jgi:hypothetical protein
MRDKRHWLVEIMVIVPCSLGAFAVWKLDLLPIAFRWVRTQIPRPLRCPLPRAWNCPLARTSTHACPGQPKADRCRSRTKVAGGGVAVVGPTRSSAPGCRC